MSIPVAVALVEHKGCYLVGRRGPDAPLSGYAEFPGGKCLPGESPPDCAIRECEEETGLRVEIIGLRACFQHVYPHGTLLLHFFDCRLAAESDPCPVRSSFQWVPRDRLADHRFPAANEEILDQILRRVDVQTPDRSAGRPALAGSECLRKAAANSRNSKDFND